MFSFGHDIGIDLGTATVLAYVKGKGIVLREPSVVAVDNLTGEVLAVGQEARRMLGRTPGNIVATRPLKDGVISDYTVTEKMLKYFINKICGRTIFSPRIMICIPSQVTEVEKKAVIDAATQAGARKVYLIEEPIAAAIGAGIDISKACGNMIVDIGRRNNRRSSNFTRRLSSKHILESRRRQIRRSSSKIYKKKTQRNNRRKNS